VKSELEILNELAVRLNLKKFPIKKDREWFEEALAPLLKGNDISIDDLKQAPIKVPGIQDIPWSDNSFHTPSGKYEFYSHTAKKEGFSPIAEYREITAKRSEEYPFYLLTPHLRGSLHSQQYVLMGEDHTPTVYMNDLRANELGIENWELVKVSTEKGQIEAKLAIDPKMSQDRIKIYEGWWLQRGGGINRLVPEVICEMGLLAAYYEVVCKVEKIRV
jgi:anaerobic selenocysteine-containing dehydrogenase